MGIVLRRQHLLNVSLWQKLNQDCDKWDLTKTTN
jgi:hypothetical protein